MTTNLSSPHTRVSCATEAPVFSDNMVAAVYHSVEDVLKNKLVECTPSCGVTDQQNSDEDDDILPPSPVNSYPANRRTPVCQRITPSSTMMTMRTHLDNNTLHTLGPPGDVASSTLNSTAIGHFPKLSPRNKDPTVEQVCFDRQSPSWTTTNPINNFETSLSGPHESIESNGGLRATNTCSVLNIADLPMLAEDRKISCLISSHHLSRASPSSSQCSQDLLKSSPFRDPDSDGGFVECFQTEDSAGFRKRTLFLDKHPANSSLGDNLGRKWPSSTDGMCSAEATHSILDNSCEIVMDKPSQELIESTADASDCANKKRKNSVGERQNLTEDMSTISTVDREQRKVCSQGTPDMSIKEPILFEAATRVYDPRERRWVLRSFSKLLSFPMLEIALSQSISDHVRLGLFDSMDWEESIPGSGMESFAETLQKHPHSSSSGYIGDISTSSRSDSQKISRFSIASSIFESVPIACSSVLSRNSLETDGKFVMPKRPVQPKQLVQSSIGGGEMIKLSSPRSPSSLNEEIEEGSAFILSQSSLTPSDLEATTPQAPWSASTEAETANPTLNPPIKERESIGTSTKITEVPSTGRKRGRKPKIPDAIRENEDDSSVPSTPIQKARRGRPPLSTTKNTDVSKSTVKTPSSTSGGSDDKEDHRLMASGEQPPDLERQSPRGNDGEKTPESKSSEDYLKDAENAWRDSRQRSFEPGKPVFAQWTDKFYYAATIIQRDSMQSEKWAVRFEDGQIRSLVEEFILPYSVLSKKQSVLILNESLNEGQPGIVVGFDKITNQHMVELDGGHQTLKLPRKRICMTQDQVKMWNEAFLVPQLFSPHTCNVSLDNIVSGRRRRTNTAPTMSPLVKTPRTPSSKPEASSGPITPKTHQGKQQPSSAGRPSLRKKVVGKRDLMMDSSTFSESSSAQLIEEEQELRTRIINRCLGTVQSSSATASRNAHESEEEAVSVESDPLTLVSMGPLPENNQLFTGYSFILTKATRMLEVDPEDVSDELEPYLEPTIYVKDHLRRQLITGGGKILERFDHSQFLEDDETVLVICNRPCRTERYIRSLAARIRAVSHDWVIHCSQKNEKIPYSRYLLPPGIDMYGHIVDWSPSTGRCFVGTRILLHGPLNFNDLWIPILVQAECVIVSRLPTRTTKRIESPTNSGAEALQQETLDRPESALHDDVPFDYIVTTKDCPDIIVQQAHRMRTPLCSTMWLIQSLIHGKVLDPHSNKEFYFKLTN